MTIFRVPGDFPSIQTAMDSPHVQRGDTILVREGAYNQVVVVPFDKVGIQVLEESGDPLESSGKAVTEVPPEPENIQPPESDAVGAPSEPPAGPEESATASSPGGPLTSPARKKAAGAVTSTGLSVLSLGRPPYWVTVYRRTLQRSPQKQPNPFFWTRFR